MAFELLVVLGIAAVVGVIGVVVGIIVGGRLDARLAREEDEPGDG